METGNFSGKIAKKIFIEGKIKAETGLHIGGSDIGLAVGSTDNVIIRCALRKNQPYIPGSSLKGKMRSLFEKANDDKFTYQSKQIPNGPCQEPGSDSGMLFGVAAEKGGTPSRVIVRDGYLKNHEVLEKAKTDMPYSEIKTETVIDRISSAANPRQIERVPAGAEFELKIILNVFKEDNEKRLLEMLFKSLTLVQDDYLGGYGSRGSGQVKFEIEKLLQKDRETYEKNEKAKPYGDYEIPDHLKH
jgi:CRISPR-associated protein Csm3